MNQEPENERVHQGEVRTAIGISAALGLLVWIAFGQTLHCGFVNYDDDVYKNPHVTCDLT